MPYFFFLYEVDNILLFFLFLKHTKGMDNRINHSLRMHVKQQSSPHAYRLLLTGHVAQILSAKRWNRF